MSYRLEIAGAVLLSAAIGTAVWAAHRTPKPPVMDFRASTVLSGPYGSRALYDVLVGLGRPVQRRRTPLFTLNADTSRRPVVLVELDPPIDLQAAEMEQVVAYVRHGGAVLSAGRGGGILQCTGWRLQPDRWRDDSAAVRGQPDARTLPKVARVLAPEPPGKRRRLEGLVKDQPELANPCDSLVALRSDTLLTAVNGSPVVLRTWYDGGGSVTLASDAGWFTNRVWRDSDVPILVLPLLASPRGARGRVMVDEYHQGFGSDEQSVVSITWDWLLSSPVGWALLQILAIALVWLGVQAVRFGPAVAVISRRRRSPLEHVEALSAGLETAGATDTAVERVVAGLRRRLSRAGSQPTNTKQIESWLRALELGIRGAQGRAAVTRLRHLITERTGEGANGSARVLATAQAVEDVWEELHPRTTRERF